MTQWPPAHPHCYHPHPEAHHWSGWWTFLESHLLVGWWTLSAAVCHPGSYPPIFTAGEAPAGWGPEWAGQSFQHQQHHLRQTTSHGGTTRADKPFWQITVWQTTSHWLSHHTLWQTTSQGFYQFIDVSVPGEILSFTPAHLDRLLLTWLAGTISFGGEPLRSTSWFWRNLWHLQDIKLCLGIMLPFILELTLMILDCPIFHVCLQYKRHNLYPRSLTWFVRSLTQHTFCPN